MEKIRALKDENEKLRKQISALSRIIEFYKNTLEEIGKNLHKKPILSAEEILALYPLLSATIDQFKFSLKIQNRLKAVGITKVIDLAIKTEKELLLNKGFGRKSLKEVKKFLFSHNLNLEMKFPDDFIELFIT